MRVLFFGDSITQGLWDKEGGWVTRIRKDYDHKYISAPGGNSPLLFNMGISGNTAASVLKRFKAETEARKYHGESLAFVFAIGTNDACFRKDGHNDSEPDTYKSELTELVAQAKHYSDRILFVGLPPAVDELVNPLPASTTGKSFTTERLKLFDTTVKNFCREQNLPFVDVFSEFSKSEDVRTLLFDGLHPNATGHEMIATLVRPKLAALTG
jgi:lysophospholipase L1-like esterase